MIKTGGTNDRVKGDDRNNSISTGAGDDTIIASKGDDKLSQAETIDYSKLDNAVTVMALWSINRDSKTGTAFLNPVQTIEKGGVGTDFVRDAKKIIGTNNKENTLDVSSSNKDIKDLVIDINLSKNFIKVTGIPNNIQNVAITQLEIVNFTNIIGSSNNDTITGANKKGKLTGGGGNDTITGGNKNDTITGSDSTARGVGEVDTLTGGGGRDKFVLGDSNGAYYVGKGKDDYATITDFNLFQDSIDLGGFKDYSFASGGGNTIELYSGKDVNTRDLIAKIQLADSGSALRKAMITTTGTSSLLAKAATAGTDNIFSEINILSGASSISETV
jgi:Ca2+-binding RTX toxin-like protein